MRRSALSICAGLIASAGPVAAQSGEADAMEAVEAVDAVDPGDLTEVFLGNWTVKGQEGIFSEKCRLLTPNSYVICEGAVTDPSEPFQWLTMTGYSHFENLYNFTEFGSDGSVFQFKGWLDDGVWTFVSHREYENSIVRIEEKRTPTAEGFLVVRNISIDGRDWENRLEEEHIRLGD